MVDFSNNSLTTEAQRTQRLHREEAPSGLFGLRDPAYEGQKVYGIPHAAVYVIDNGGKVAWAKVESNYRERPTNQEIRAALDAAKVRKD